MSLSENFHSTSKETEYVETTKGKIKKAIPFFGEREPHMPDEERLPSFGTSPMKPKKPIHWSEED